MATAATVSVRLDGDSARLIRELDKASRQTNKTMKKIGRNVQQVRRSFDQVRSAAGLLAGALGTRELARYADQFQTIQNRLKLVTEGSNDLAKATENIFGIAQRTRAEFGDTAELYSRLALNTRDLNLSQEELLRLTESISQAAAVSGATQVEQANAVRQLTQALASGIVRAEEYNSIIEQTPRIAQAIADGLGVTVGELRNLVVTGQLTAEDVLGAFASQRDQLEKEFSTLAPTLEQSLTTLRNSAVRAIGEPLSQTIAPLISEVLNDLREGLDSADFQESVTKGVDIALRSVGAFLDGIRAIEIAFKQIAAGGQLSFGLVASGLAFVAEGVGGFVNSLFAVVEILSEINAASARLLGLENLAQSFDAVADSAAGNRARISEFTQGLRDAASGVIETAKFTQGEVQDLLLKELPSTGIEKALARVREEAAKTSSATRQEIEKIAKPQPLGLGQLINETQTATIRQVELQRDAQDEIRNIVLSGQTQITNELQNIIEARAQAQVAAQKAAAEQLAAATGTSSTFDEEKALAKARISLADQTANALIAARQRVAETGNLETFDPALIREQAQISAQELVNAKILADEQILEADRILRGQLLASEEEYGAAAIALAEQQAFEKIRLQLEARQIALDENGLALDPEQRLIQEQQVAEEQLRLTEQYLNRRLLLEGQFGQAYKKLTETIAGAVSKEWIANNEKTLKNTAIFGSAMLNIANTLFGDNKLVAIANATISTLTGVAKALELPYPANIAAAAQVAATGYAQVAAIKSTNVGSGITAPTVGAGPVPTTSEITDFDALDEVAPGSQSVQIFFEGPVLADDESTKQFLTEVLREAANEKDVVFINGGSRQADEIRNGG